MRYALFSDVHGELEALQAVLTDAANRQVDEYLCLGDVCNEECMALINQVQAPTVFGNWEVMLAEVSAMGGLTYPWLLTLPPLLKRPEFWAAHADPIWSPDLPDLATYMQKSPYVHRSDDGFPNHKIMTARLAESMAYLEQQHIPLFFYGHIHQQRVWQKDIYGHIHELPAQTFILQPQHTYMVSIGNVTPTVVAEPTTYAIFDSELQQVELLRVGA